MHTSDLAPIARQAAAAISRTHSWMDRSELEQEAWAAMLAALPHVDPQGVNAKGYLYRAALRAVKHAAWSASMPVSMSERSRSPERVRSMKAAAVPVEELCSLAAPVPSVDALVAQKERRDRLAALVAEKLASGREAEAVSAVLCGDLEPAEAAEAYGLETRRLYRATEAATRWLRRNSRVPAFAEVL